MAQWYSRGFFIFFFIFKLYVESYTGDGYNISYASNEYIHVECHNSYGVDV